MNITQEFLDGLDPIQRTLFSELKAHLDEARGKLRNLLDVLPQGSKSTEEEILEDCAILATGGEVPKDPHSLQLQIIFLELKDKIITTLCNALMEGRISGDNGCRINLATIERDVEFLTKISALDWKVLPARLKAVFEGGTFSPHR